ncbi:MAG: hypothetical protein ACLSAH_20880 [Bilophila wadsworthia]
MAITRPITVQIAGVVSGMFGTGGVAYAAGAPAGVAAWALSGVSNPCRVRGFRHQGHHQ